MLIDEVEIVIKAGHGGPGRVSFIKRKKAGPDGGDGGKGGDVYIQASSDIYLLNQYVSKRVLEAENGIPGGDKLKSGSEGRDLILRMPVGSFITDERGEVIELTKEDEKILFAEGGLGGKGNAFFKSPSNTTPRYAQKGLEGQEKKLSIKLKLIADFGLIGLPNAGKSSLLNEITNATPKIGAYPFTTLEPNLGMLGNRVIADLPGLIEGASENKGLGHKFLKHIEKVKLLLHCISSESDNPLKDYKTVREELKKYNPELLNKEEMILLTKSDLVDSKELEKKVKILSKLKKKIIPISIHNWDSLQTLIRALK